jgi:hypothetical protein
MAISAIGIRRHDKQQLFPGALRPWWRQEAGGINDVLHEKPPEIICRTPTAAA